MSKQQIKKLKREIEEVVHPMNPALFNALIDLVLRKIAKAKREVIKRAENHCEEAGFDYRATEGLIDYLTKENKND
jgi:ribosome recycling factor